jgi:hypothetical protein
MQLCAHTRAWAHNAWPLPERRAHTPQTSFFLCVRSQPLLLAAHFPALHRSRSLLEMLRYAEGGALLAWELVVVVDLGALGTPLPGLADSAAVHASGYHAVLFDPCHSSRRLLLGPCGARALTHVRFSSFRGHKTRAREKKGDFQSALVSVLPFLLLRAPSFTCSAFSSRAQGGRARLRP